MVKKLVWIERDENVPKGKKNYNDNLVVLDKETGNELKWQVGDNIAIRTHNDSNLIKGKIVGLPRGCVEIKDENRILNMSFNCIFQVFYGDRIVNVYD